MPKAKTKSDRNSKSKVSSTGIQPGKEPVVLDDMTVSTFQTWSDASLRVYLQLRSQSVEGDHQTLAARAFCVWEKAACSIDPDFEHQLRSNLVDYKEKLKVGGQILPDPFTVKEGWLSEKDGRCYWPSLYIMDITDLLKLTTPDQLYNRLMNEYKQGKAYRMFTSGFVQDVAFHPISPNSHICFLSAKVKASMSPTSYDVWAAVEKDLDGRVGGKIVSAYCTCTAGLKGSCNHIIGLLFRVDHAVKVGLTKVSCTSLLCGWKMAGVDDDAEVTDLRPMSQEKWTKEKYFQTGGHRHSASVQHLALRFDPSSASQTKKEKAKAAINALIRAELPNSCYTQLIDLKEAPKLLPPPDAPPTPLECGKSLSHPATPQDLLESMRLSDNQIDNLQKLTVGQSDSDDWYQHRYGRLTSSKFKHIVTRTKTLMSNPSEDPNPLIGVIMGYSKPVEAKGTKHGKAMEPFAKKQYINIMKRRHQGFVASDKGFVVDSEHPFLGASPDLVVQCSDKCFCGGGLGLCEIKSPEKIKHDPRGPSAENYKDHLHEVDGKVCLRRDSSFYYQIIGQMYVMKRAYCDIFIFTVHGYHLERIPFSEDFWQGCFPYLQVFWNRYIANELIYGAISCSLQKQSSDVSEIHNYYKSPSLLVNPGSLDDTTYSAHTQAGPLTKPRLPEVHLCPVCELDVIEPQTDADESIQCDFCKLWCHAKCAHIKITAYQVASQFKCPKCRQII